MTERKSITLHRLRAMHSAGEKIAMLTCYDASFARVLDDAMVDVPLVGDSLGMVLQGRNSTVPVSLDDMAYHTQCVARGNRHAWIVADLPFGRYHESTDQAVGSAVRLMQSSADMVKLEGGGSTAQTAPLRARLHERRRRCRSSRAADQVFADQHRFVNPPKYGGRWTPDLRKRSTCGVTPCCSLGQMGIDGRCSLAAGARTRSPIGPWWAEESS